MSDLSVNSILDAIGGATTTINGFTPTVSNMTGRNRIINGDMRISQRNAGAAVTVTSGANFVVDRFLSNNNTGTGTITGQQVTLGNSKSLKITATAAATTLTTTNYIYAVNHIIEAQNCFDLNAKSVTLSFKVETNWAGFLPVAINKSNYSRSYVVDAPVLSGINTISITIPLEADTITTNSNATGIHFSIGANNEGTYRTATTGSWVAGEFMASTSSTQWAKTTGNFINVTEVQLEEGSVATPFERRQYGQELALCQRYAIVYGGSDVRHLGVASMYSSTAINLTLHTPTTMRSQPTLTKTVNGSSLWLQVYVGASGTSSNATPELGEGGGTNSFRLYCPGAHSGSTTGYAAWVHILAGASLLLSAEL